MNCLTNSLRLLSCGLGLLILAVVCIGQPRPRAPLPFDPLTEEEKRSAVKIALADKQVQEMLGTGRREVVSVAVLPEKVSRDQVERAAAGRAIAMSRILEVIFFRYEGEIGVRAVVDLTHQKTGEVTRLSSGEVPMSQSDLAEAWRLASRDAEVRDALGATVDKFQVLAPPLGRTAAPPRYQVEGLRVEAATESDACYKHRCLQLMFRSDAGYLVEPMVIVDLTAQKVQVERKKR